MAMSTSGQDVKDNGVGPSNGLSFRERMRLKAQQKFQDQAASSSSTAQSRSDLTSLVAIDVDGEDEDDDLGSLTFGRATRQAALKRPATYSIDPLDDSSRLKRHPNKLPTSLAKYAATSGSKTKGIDGLLREQQRKAKRGTDAEGLSKADAIALSMEQERLGRMGIAYTSSNGDSIDHKDSLSSKEGSAKASRAHASSLSLNAPKKNGEEQKLTVKALSPTIPSYLWSSQSEAGDSDDDMKDQVGLSTAEHKLADTLAAVGADEDEKQLALEILQQDVGNRKGKQTQKSKGHITFYRTGKVLAPPPTFFCPLPSIAKNAIDIRSSPPANGDAVAADTRASLPPQQPPSVSDELEWNTLARRILLAGFLPPSLELDKRQIRRILVWLSISFILEIDVMQSRLISTLLQALVFESEKSYYDRQLESAIPKALVDIVRRVPLLLNRIGMDDEVLEQCFPDNSKVTDVPLFTVAQRKEPSSSQSNPQDGISASSPSAEFTEFKVYLTQAERDDILVNLARMLDMIACAAHGPTFIADNLSIFAGYIASMAIACAASTGHALPEQVGPAFNSVFRAAVREDDEVVKMLQEEVCRRVFGALRSDSIAVRARLVTVLPGEGKEVGAVRRWIAWCALTEHVAQAGSSVAAASPLNTIPSSDPLADESEDVQDQQLEDTAHWRRAKFQPLSIDMDMLIAAIDTKNAASPFYVAPFSTRSAMPSASASPAGTPKGGSETPNSHSVEARTTDFESIIAATQLLTNALRDLPVHMCSFDRTNADRSTPTPSQLDGKPLTDPERKKWPRALRLALAPYLLHNPRLDESRVAALHTIVERLGQVNSRIRDNRGNVILETLAKDALQRTACLLEYQLDMFAPGGGGASFIK